MRDLVRRIRDHLLGTADSVCLERLRLVTEAYRRHEDLPAPERRARAFAHVLENMTLDVHSNPVFAGNTSSQPRAWMLLPEYALQCDGQVAYENEGLAHLLDNAIPEDLRAYWQSREFGGSACGVGHLAGDLDRLVREGLESIVRETEKHAEEGDAERRAYRRAMNLACRAVMAWAARYA